ncbi:hypothetical protein V3C33_15305 [Micrococcaceae bacterium Sec5.7]
MTKLLRSLRTELRYQAWSKMLLSPLVITVLSLGAAFSGSVSNAASSLDRLLSTKAQAEANGISLGDAMNHPLNISVQGNQQVMDNPLRFDYETAYNAHRALDGLNSIGTGLEMITFIVLPILFFTYGCAVAVTDVRQRILKQRVSVQGRRPYVLAKVMMITATAIASVLLCAALSIAAAPILKAVFLTGTNFDFSFDVQAAGNNNPAAQIGFSAATAFFFGQLGFFVGLATRSIVLPSLLAFALLMVAPFAGPYDPRNILSTAGQWVFNFWGGFTPRAMFPVPAGVGLLLMMLGLCSIAACCAIVWARRTKFV